VFNVAINIHSTHKIFTNISFFQIQSGEEKFPQNTMTSSYKQQLVSDMFPVQMKAQLAVK